ncbi:hypothetical protein FOA52_011351 [Chlamydomonas sp. UWO 241]|nr:hypothetical protein FOA52_011351 [Chlamydomonas sp. UWO 241]
MERIATSDPEVVNGQAKLAAVSETVLLNLFYDPGTGGAGGASQAGTSGGDTQPGDTQGGAGTAVAKPLEKLKRTAALRDLVASKWLSNAPSPSNCFTLGVRSLMELQEFLLGLDGLPVPTKALFDAVM